MDLPWSMWAMMEKLRMRERGRERRTFRWSLGEMRRWEVMGEGGGGEGGGRGDGVEGAGVEAKPR